MPCESFGMSSTETSENSSSAIEKGIQTTESASKRDENLCLEGSGPPYVSGGHPVPSPLLLPSGAYPNIQRPLYAPHPESFASQHPTSPAAASQSHVDPNASFISSHFSSGGAFRSIAASNPVNSRNGFHGSAFVPASSARCLQNPKIEPGLESSSPLPQGPPGLLQIKQEGDVQRSNLDDSTADLSLSDRTTPEENCRTLRKLKKRAFSETQAPCCPVCGVTVRPSELSTHFHHEVCRLEKVARSVQRPSRENTPLALPSGSRKKESTETNTPEARWEAYERIKNNRNSRLTARANRGKKKEETTCPVCAETVSGTQEELNNHVELCLKKRKETSSDDEPVDVEGDETFEEYEWGGETRIRATSLVSGGLSTLGFHTCKKTPGDEEDDLDLNVDGDDTATFGQPQYSEVDVIPCQTDEPTEDKARRELREAVLRNNNSPTNSNTVTLSKWTSRIKDSTNCGEICSEDKLTDSNQIISSLKQRIEELESPNSGKFKCLICMDSYTKPVVSISCWHVHCEECWLRTLGVKKLCPQCNTITSPTDLRVVYL